MFTHHVRPESEFRALQQQWGARVGMGQGALCLHGEGAEGLLLYGNLSDAWLPFKYLLERPVCWLALRCLRVLASAGCASYHVRMQGGSWGFLGALW